MFRTYIRPDGTLPIGEAARCLGFAPGAVVDVIVTRAGSLILALADDAEAVELDVMKLPPGRARQALVDSGPANKTRERPMAVVRGRPQ